MTHEEAQNLAALAAVGTINTAEKAALDDHVRDCAECAAAVREFGEAAASIALSLPPVHPPAETWDAIRSSIAKSDQVTPRQGRKVWWLAPAAAVLLGLWFWGEFRVRDLRRELEQLPGLEAERRRLQSEVARLSSALTVLTTDDTRVFALAGQEVAPAATARVFLDEPRRRALLFFRNLPRNAADKNYELWIIRADRVEPQPAGLFDVDARGNASLTVDNLPVGVEIKALAVTLEPRGGSPAPTSAMYLLGNSG